MSKEINKLAYFIQGGIEANAILTKAIAYIIYCNQTKESLVSKYSKIQALYAREYKINLPESLIHKELASNFFVKNGQYEIKADLGYTLNQISENYIKAEKKFTEKLNNTKNIFFEFYNKNAVTNINKNSSDILFSSLFIDGTSSNRFNEDNEEYCISFSTDYILKQQFLRYLLDKNDENYEILQDIEIVNSITTNKTLNFSKQDYGKIKLYLDTPVLLKLLGYDGKEYAFFLTKLFETMRCQLFVFEHTFEEAWGILYAWKNAYNQNNFAAKGLDLYLLAKKQYGNEANTKIPLEKEKFRGIIETTRINQLKITILDKPELSKDNNIYSENVLIQAFEKNYKNTYKSFPDRITKDIDSICGIQALRLNENIKGPKKFEDARYYFLTDNKQYARISEKNYIDPTASSFCEVQYLDNIVYNLWIDSGKEILPSELFKLRCLTNNGISDDFRNEFTKIVNRLEKLEKEYDITDTLMNNPELIQKAHDVYISNNKSIKHLTYFIQTACNRHENVNQNTNESSEEQTLQQKYDELQRKYNELIKRKESLFKRIVNWIRNIFKIEQ